MKAKKGIFIAITFMLIAMFSSSAAIAADFRAPDKENGNVTVNKDEKVGNLYTGGATITINSDVEKSLHVGGGSVFINGNVGQNIYAGGGTLILRGSVADSAHIGGGNIIIEGNIAGDLLAGGGNITISPSASIGGDLIVGGGNVVVEGPVLGNVSIGAGQATINSKIGGSVTGTVEGLSLGAEAEIGRDLNYKSLKEAQMANGATILGKTTFEQIEKREASGDTSTAFITSIITVALFIKLLIVIATGLVLVYLLKKVTDPTLRESLTKFWPSLGIGFAALVVTPIIAIILAVTVAGIGLAGILGAVYVLFLIIAKFLAPIVFGSWLIKIVKKKTSYQIRWHEVVIGAIAFTIIGMIPFIGWIVVFVFMLISLGGLTRIAHRSLLR